MHTRIANQIWAVLKFGSPGIIKWQSNGEWSARLQSRNAIQLPVRGETMQPAAQACGCWYAPSISNSKAMAKVEIRATIVEAEVAAVFWRALIKSASAGCIIE